MAGRPQLAPEDQMTIEEFLAFTDTRPDDETWELIEGVPVMSPSPTDFHQIIVANICGFLWRFSVENNARWIPLPGTGTRVPGSPRSLPQPDVMVKEEEPTGSPVSDDALVLFEVLSRSNTKADQAWRKRVYSSVPNCQHYVTVSLKSVETVAYDRAAKWEARRLTSLSDSLHLPALELAVPLTEIYRRTPLGPKSAR